MLVGRADTRVAAIATTPKTKGMSMAAIDVEDGSSCKDCLYLVSSSRSACAVGHALVHT
jgi:hypothetical protein